MNDASSALHEPLTPSGMLRAGVCGWGSLAFVRLEICGV